MPDKIMQTALKLENLSKTYANGTLALQGINLTVNQGDFFALLGPNGAGKSTTIGIITSLVTKTSGEVKILDYDLTRQPRQAKLNIGVVPQEFNFSIFETPWDIILNQAGYYGIARRVAAPYAKELLQNIGLWEKRQQQARFLSGGMKRRLMIARALIHKPRLLILDEPTAGVDIEIRRAMWEFLTALNQQGTTVILTTHYLEEAEQLCKNIAIINHGVIVENTSMQALLQKLNTQTFILNLAQHVPAIFSLANFPCELLDSHTLAVEVKHEQSLNQLFSELSAQQVLVQSMRTKSNRLEELFIQLTKGSA